MNQRLRWGEMMDVATEPKAPSLLFPDRKQGPYRPIAPFVCAEGYSRMGSGPGPERQALQVCSRTAFHCYPPVPFACDMLSLTVDTQAAVTRSPDQKRRADALARHAEGGGSA